MSMFRILHLVYSIRGRGDGITLIVDRLNSELNRIPGTRSEVVSIAVPLRKWFTMFHAILQHANRSDLVVFHGIYRPQYWIGAALLQVLGRPFLVVPHCSLIESSMKKSAAKKSVANELFVQRFLENAIAIQYMNHGESRRSMPVNARSFLLGNGVDMPDGEYYERRKAVVAARGNGRAQLSVVFIGRIDINHKGLDLLVEKIAEHAGVFRTAGVQFFIVGPDIRGQRATVQRLCDALMVSDIVSFRDNVDRGGVSQVLLHADIFIMMSRYEGEPMAALEAAVHGVPVVLAEGTNIAAAMEALGLGVVYSGDLPRDISAAMALYTEEYWNCVRRFAHSRSWTEVALGTRLLYERAIALRRADYGAPI